MIHSREDYQHIQDPTGRFGKDEPVMVFRAKDMLAPSILFEYARMLTMIRAEEHMIRAVTDHAHRMLDWQKANGTKLPDMPKDMVHKG